MPTNLHVTNYSIEMFSKVIVLLKYFDPLNDIQIILISAILQKSTYCSIYS